jgi:hypothetical protein
MKNILMRTTIYFILFVTICSCASSKNGSKAKVVNIEIDEAFKRVYQATQESLAEADNNTLKLESIDLSFSTTTTYSVEGGVKMWVVSGKYSRKSSTSKKAVFTFTQDENVKKALTEDPQIQGFKKYLISVIKSTENIQKIEKFGLSEIEVEVEFTLNKSSEGGIEIEILPVTPSLSGSRERELAHSISMKFKKE